MSQLPLIAQYEFAPSKNALFVQFGDLTIWFSYRTPIAFQVAGQPRVISENYWGAQTGRHLNLIDPDKTKRVKQDEFNDRLENVVDTINTALTRAGTF